MYILYHNICDMCQFTYTLSLSSGVLQLSAWKPTAGFTSTFSDPSIGMWVKCSTLSDYLRDEPKFPHRLHYFETTLAIKKKTLSPIYPIAPNTRMNI